MDPLNIAAPILARTVLVNEITESIQEYQASIPNGRPDPGLKALSDESNELKAVWNNLHTLRM